MTVLLVGDDQAADHHDAGLMDQAGGFWPGPG